MPGSRYSEDFRAGLLHAARLVRERAADAARTGAKSNNQPYWEHREVEALAAANAIEAEARALGEHRGEGPIVTVVSRAAQPTGARPPHTCPSCDDGGLPAVKVPTGRVLSSKPIVKPGARPIDSQGPSKTCSIYPTACPSPAACIAAEACCAGDTEVPSGTLLQADAPGSVFTVLQVISLRGCEMHALTKQTCEQRTKERGKPWQCRSCLADDALIRWIERLRPTTSPPGGRP